MADVSGSILTGVFFTARIRSMTGRYCFHRCLSMNIFFGGGFLIQPWTGVGAPIQPWMEEVPIQPWTGEGVLIQPWGGPDPALDGGGGVPVKGKKFWHQIWLDTCSDWEKKILSRDPPPPPVKGKIVDTRFGLIHVQTGKKFLVEGPPTPPVKGKVFDTRFGLIHVQIGKKNFCRGTPPRNSKDSNILIIANSVCLWKLRLARMGSLVISDLGILSRSVNLKIKNVFYGSNVLFFQTNFQHTLKILFFKHF